MELNSYVQDAYKILDEVSAVEPNQSLYHYTDTNGMVGMYESKKLWATSYLHLNDPTEYKFGIETLHRCIKTDSYGSKYEIFGDHIKTGVLQELKHTDIFVFCLTSSGDDLTHWREYGDRGFGYSLCFNSDPLKAGIHTQFGNNDDRVFFRKMIYDEEKQKCILDAVFNWAYQLYDKYVDNPVRVDFRDAECEFSRLIICAAVRTILIVISCFKNNKFKSESEYRIIVHATKRKEHSIKFRNGKHGLTPYYPLGMHNDERLPISGITFGILNSSERVLYALERLFTRDMPLHRSECPM